MTNEPSPVLVTITGRDLLDKLEALATAMQGLSIKLDGLPAQVMDHESRIRKVEYRQWFTAGVASVGGGAITAVLEALIQAH